LLHLPLVWEILFHLSLFHNMKTWNFSYSWKIHSVCEISSRPIDIVYKNSSLSSLIFVGVDLMSMQKLSCKEHACWRLTWHLVFHWCIFIVYESQEFLYSNHSQYFDKKVVIMKLQDMPRMQNLAPLTLEPRLCNLVYANLNCAMLV
jgi:hypothetical protein